MALQFVQVDHRYGRRQSLYGVSLTVHRGDCYGFIGHNGAGKTTAMRIALGLDRPARGRILVDGFDAAVHPVEARARLGGTIEITGFYPWASATQNLVELARLQGMNRRDARNESARWLDIVGLSGRADNAVRTFSQGMKQRLALAQALLGEPSYVLLDEPQNGLDPEGIAELREVLRRLTRDCGMTVLLSSHQLRELTGLCNRIGVLRQGRILLEAETDRLLAATAGRYELRTDDPNRATRVLEALGVRRTDTEQGLIELGKAEPKAVVRALVQAEIGVEHFAPRPTSLEEVYLRLAESPVEVAHPAAEPPLHGGAPRARLAPRLASLRMLGFDLRRNLRRWPSLVLPAIPALLAWQRIGTIAANHDHALAEVEAGRQFSESSVTAFEAVGHGMSSAMPALALVIVAVGSQSIAGEVTLGTLRNLLVRPLSRTQIAVGKAGSICAMGIGMLLVTYAVTFSTAASHFEFGDRYEITKAGSPQLWIEAIDVWPAVPSVLLAPLLPLLAFAGLGFLAGAIANRSIWALAIGLTAGVALDLGRTLARPLGFEAWLPSAYLPSALGDTTSEVAYFLDLARGSAEAVFRFESTALLTPAIWIVATFGLAGLVLARKHAR